MITNHAKEIIFDLVVTTVDNNTFFKKNWYIMYSFLS